MAKIVATMITAALVTRYRYGSIMLRMVTIRRHQRQGAPFKVNTPGRSLRHRQYAIGGIPGGQPAPRFTPRRGIGSFCCCYRGHIIATRQMKTKSR